MIMRVVLSAIAASLCFSAPSFSQVNISGSLLPSSRSVAVGEAATAFAAITNANNSTATATSCRPECFNCGPGGVDAVFSYQTTSAVNVLTGTPNTPADIAPGSTQNFVFSLTPNSIFTEQAAVIDFTCDGGQTRAAYRPGLTDFILSAGPNEPDILPIASTLSLDGVARVSTPTGFIPFSVAAINIGAGNPGPDGPDTAFAGGNEATITVTPEHGGLELPLRYDICEANNLAVCIGARSTSVTTQIGDSPSYFVVRALGEGAGVPFYPDIVRVTLNFTDAGGVLRGRTSVAAVVTGPTPGQDDTNPEGIWFFDISGGTSTAFGEIGDGILVIDEAGGYTAYGNFATLGQNDGQYGLYGEVSTPDPGSFSGIAFELNDNNPAVQHNFAGTWQHNTFVRGNVSPVASDNPDVSGPSLIAGQPRRLRAVYSTLTDRPVSLPGLAGSYDLVDEENGVLADIGDITISSLGQMTGTVSDPGGNTCDASGAIVHVNQNENIFFVNLQLTGPCQFAAGYGGHAAQLDDAENGFTNAIAMIFGNENAIVQVALVPDAQFPQ